MAYIQRANTVTKEYTGNTIFPFNKGRAYFFIVMTSGSGTIEFGGGGGKIPLEEGFHYTPVVVPTSEISIETTGTFVVHAG